jgi:tripartite-type tricarboxylate transporter receptor subunit TctC
MELFKTLTGTDIQNIPYKGSGALNNDLIAGHVRISIGGAAASIPHVRAGRLRALGIGDSKRSAFLPDIPTIAEAGVPGFEATVWTGMLAPARTPRPIVERVNREVVRIVQSPEFRQWLNPLGADAVGSTPDEWGRTIVIEIEKWTKIARRAGLGV